jgi:hypothetical protein
MRSLPVLKQPAPADPVISSIHTPFHVSVYFLSCLRAGNQQFTVEFPRVSSSGFVLMSQRERNTH